MSEVKNEMNTKIGLNFAKGWVKTDLGKVIKIIGGGTPKTSVPEYWDGEIPWLSVVDFNDDNRWVNSTEKTITSLGLEKSSTKLLNEGDIIISARGTVGAMAQLKREMSFNQSCYGIRNIENISEIDFIFYLLKFSLKQINQNTYGAVFDTITTKTFDYININLPPLPEQKAIAKVLTAFDDKIENLRAQNDTLEQTAQTIFTEWFGKYKLEDELPEGWEVKSLDKIALHLKKNIKPFNEPDKDFAHYSLPAFDNGLKPVKEKGIEIKSNKYSVVNWSFLVSKLNPFTPRIWTIYESENNRICSTEFQVVKPKKDIYFSLIHCLLNSSRFTSDLSQKVKGTSSSHQRVNPKDIFDINLIIPNMEVLSDFNKVVYPMILKKNINHQQIQSLTKTRDTLLPKLMSGQLRVKNIETLELAEK